jgi:hypothetical protein
MRSLIPVPITIGEGVSRERVIYRVHVTHRDPVDSEGDTGIGIIRDQGQQHPVYRSHGDWYLDTPPAPIQLPAASVEDAATPF